MLAVWSRQDGYCWVPIMVERPDSDRSPLRLPKDEPFTTTTDAERLATRDDWFGVIQSFLELAIRMAPDETCRIFARTLWDQTAEFTYDD